MSTKMGSGRRPFALSGSTLKRGLGQGVNMDLRGASEAMEVTPPNFGYPFRQPSSWPSNSLAGMSM